MTTPKMDASQKVLESKSSLTLTPPYEWLYLSKDKLLGVIKIFDKEYVAERQARDVWLLTQVEPSRKTVYTLILDTHCGCDGYKFTKKCKHMDVFKAMRNKKMV